MLKDSLMPQTHPANTWESTAEDCKLLRSAKNIIYERIYHKNISVSVSLVILGNQYFYHKVFGTRRCRVQQTVAPHHGVWIIETNYCESLAVGLTYMLFKMSQRHSSAFLLGEMVSTVLCGYAAII